MKISTTVRNVWLGIAALVGATVIWYMAALKVGLPVILPTPSAVFLQLTAMVRKTVFWHHVGATLLRGLAGFLISLGVGLVVGLAAGIFPTLEALLRPIIVVLRSTPSMAFIVLALVWFKGDWVTIFVIFLVVFPMIAQNVIEGIRNIDRELLEMVTVFRVRKLRRLTALYLPSVASYLAAGIAAGLGITWKVLIAAEVLAYPRMGIGTQMDTARTYLETDKVFAWSLVVIGIGLCFDYVLGAIRRKQDEMRKGSRNV
ncbi:MAG TPA: ABC transporter permease [Bacillota bacterium]|nr:ABC transporter permease [Bacillota bacterium]